MSVIPLRVDELSMSAATFTQTLLAASFVKLIAVRFSNPMNRLLGPRRLVEWSMTLFVSAIVAQILVPTVLLFFVASMTVGISIGFFITSLNGHASFWEEAAGKRRMSRLHGCLSLGICIGGGYAQLLLWVGIGHAWLSLVLLPVLAAIQTLSSQHMLNREELSHSDPQSEADPLPHSAQSSLPEKRRNLWASPAFWLFGCLMFLTAATELAALDWGTLFLTHGLGASPTLGAMMVFIFGGLMAIGRFSGDFFVTRFSFGTVLIGPMALAGLLLIVASLYDSVLLALIAFGVYGFATANAFPIILSESVGYLGIPRFQGIVWMVGSAQLGSLVGPAFFGLIGHYLSLSSLVTAIGGCVILYSLVTWVTAHLMKSRTQPSASSP